MPKEQRNFRLDTLENDRLDALAEFAEATPSEIVGQLIPSTPLIAAYKYARGSALTTAPVGEWLREQLADAFFRQMTTDRARPLAPRFVQRYRRDPDTLFVLYLEWLAARDLAETGAVPPAWEEATGGLPMTARLERIPSEGVWAELGQAGLHVLLHDGERLTDEGIERRTIDRGDE